MRRFLVKILTLENALGIAISGWYRATCNIPNLLTAKITAAFDVTQRSSRMVVFDGAIKISRDMAQSATYKVNKIWDTISTKLRNATTIQHFVDTVCFALMDNYEIIFQAIDNLSQITPQPNINPIAMARQLIAFDDDDIKKLFFINKPFRLFYFFTIHEIISIIREINIDNCAQDIEQPKLLTEFYELLNKLGDLQDYNHLFVETTVHRITRSERLNELTMNIKIPSDVMKIIITYCRLSIYNTDDVKDIYKKFIQI